MRAQRVGAAGAAALMPVALLASACSSGGGGTDTSAITDAAEYGDGTFSGDLVADAVAEPGDWQDLMPDEGGEGLPDDDSLDDWESGTGAVGSWFSTDDYYNYLTFYEDGSAFVVTESGTCYGGFEDASGAITMTFDGCDDPVYASGTAALAGEALEVTWSDGTSEGYSQNAADAPPFPGDGGTGGSGGATGGDTGGTGGTGGATGGDTGGSGGTGGDSGGGQDGGDAANVGAEISGIWSGGDGSFFMVIPAEETGTGIANVAYLPPGEATECLGILLADLLGEGWDATITCEDPEAGGGFRHADVTLDGEVLNVEWPDTGESAAYQWFSEWDA